MSNICRFVVDGGINHLGQPGMFDVADRTGVMIDPKGFQCPGMDMQEPISEVDVANEQPPPRRLMPYVGVSLLIIVSLTLVVWHLDWGLPTATSWAPDSIAGTRTLATIGHWPDRWPTHYPPFHFMINRLLYAGNLQVWEGDDVMRWVKPSNDRNQPGIRGKPGEDGVVPIFAPPVADRIGALIMKSRVMAALMSLATVLMVAACAWRLFDDKLCGFLAGLTLATCAEWVYFSHVGTLDIPHMFWFVASLYAYIRINQTDRWVYYAPLGVFTAFSVATKDAVAGAYMGMVLVIIATRWVRYNETHHSMSAICKSIFHPKICLGLICFAVPYGLINGLFTHPDVYINRLNYYLSGPGIEDFNQTYQGPFWLIVESLAVAAKALGWPMLLMFAVATVVGLMSWRRVTLWMLVPCVTYYLIVCQFTGMVYARMLFPVYLCLSILVGRAISVWFLNQKIPAVARYLPGLLLYLSSMGYCFAVDLEMTNDTRYRAEQWLIDHVPRDEWIGVFAHPQYLPRFLVTGHHARPMPMEAEAIAKLRPRYLILTSHNYDDFDEPERACMAELSSGRMGYRPIDDAHFTKQYLPPARWLPAMVGWGTRGAGKVSPDIQIFTRIDGYHD